MDITIRMHHFIFQKYLILILSTLKEFTQNIMKFKNYFTYNSIIRCVKAASNEHLEDDKTVLKF